MTPEHYSTSAPASLLAMLEKHLQSANRIELWRRAGQGGPTPTGRRWEVDGDDDPHDVAQAIYDDACSHFASEGGKEKRYRAHLYGESIDEQSAEFTVTTESVSSAIEHAQGSWLAAITGDRRDLARENLLCLREMRRMVGAVTSMLPGLIELRIDALEDHAEAIAEGLGRPGRRRKAETPDDDGNKWDGTVETLREAIRTFGPAAAASAFDLTPEQIQALGLAPPPPDQNDVRALMKSLASSLDKKQQAELGRLVGAAGLTELTAITGLTDESEARTRTLELLASLDGGADALIKPLREDQRETLARIVELVDDSES